MVMIMATYLMRSLNISTKTSKTRQLHSLVSFGLVASWSCAGTVAVDYLLYCGLGMDLKLDSPGSDR